MKKTDEQKSRERAYWCEVIARQQVSGLARKQFCINNGISYSTFKNWIYRLTEGPEIGKKAEDALFTPVLVKEAEVCSHPEPVEAPLIMDFKDFRLIITPNFGSETLRRLLSVVRGPHV